MTTIEIYISHDSDVIDLIRNEYPLLTVNLDSNPYRTPITGPKSALVPFLLDYYYWENDYVMINHPQIVQSDIDSYLRSRHH